MVKPYSEDLRVRVVGRVEAGHPVREVAETFGVSVSSVVKWSQRKRRTGSVAARPMGSRQARSVRTSYGSVWRLLNDAGISFKKKPARQRARSA